MQREGVKNLLETRETVKNKVRERVKMLVTMQQREKETLR
jgi:hypothetical protein